MSLTQMSLTQMSLLQMLLLQRSLTQMPLLQMSLMFFNAAEPGAAPLCVEKTGIKVYIIHICFMKSFLQTDEEYDIMVG